MNNTEKKLDALIDALVIVGKVFGDVKIDYMGDVIINHRGVPYGVLARRYENIGHSVPPKDAALCIAIDIIDTVTREIINEKI